jgi:Putative esterase
VLQDNGSDTLSVVADGSFAFGTQLAGGSAYSVTVKTNPAGQTCSVANGSGTVGSADVTTVAVSCAASVITGGSATDDFNRADGPIGGNWTDYDEGGLTIKSQTAAGTTSANSGDIRTAETYGSDQYSAIQITSTQLTGGQWIGPAVRVQNGGLNEYLGFYFWNNGSPDLMLFKRTSGTWIQLGSTYYSGALPVGTALELSVAGTTLTFMQDGVPRITATDGSLTGGAPGIMAYGTGQADNWSGGNLAAGPSYSVGGTVSGLNGTVILQGNASDTLSVSADGNFTFGTPVPAGSAYNVTVKNGPSGQTCSVANGTGTVGSSNITNVAVLCQRNASGTGSDDFSRADGALGSNWTDVRDGGLAITSQVAAGTNGGGGSGDIRTGEAYSNNQFSQIQTMATQLTGGQWIGASVRMQSGGQNGYTGLYFWNNGSPMLMLFKRNGSTWSQLGNTYNCRPLPAGTRLKLMVVGNTLAFMENGVERIAAYDDSYVGGAPGIMAHGAAQVDNWSGGTAGFEMHYLGKDSADVETYDVISANNGYGPQPLRVLRPTNPAASVAHNFLYTLPVEAGQGTAFGDGLQTVQLLNAQNEKNLTVIEPSFAAEPWYADNAADPSEQEETFMATELQPWVTANLSTTGTEQSWLIGFSKSGIGAQDLLLKHPDVFTLAASWDFPADMSSYDQ